MAIYKPLLPDIDGTVICRLTIDKRVSGPWLCPLKYFISSWNRRGKFHQHFTFSFCVRRSKKCKNVCQLISDFLHFWDLNTLNLLVECWWNSPQESISSTICTQIFVRKCFTQLFSSYVLAFVIFWHKNIGAKGDHKMLMKLTPGGIILLSIHYPYGH